MNLDFLKIKHENKREFEMIANKLFNDFAIQNHESTFRLSEIEFYWTSPNHKDDSTYQRKYVNPNNGDWFFHYSGVDIALRNDEIEGFGGILIRGIYCIEEDKAYKRPMICAMKLFSGTNAFSKSIKTMIVEHKFNKKEINITQRIGLGKNAVESGTDKLNYRFTINL